VLLWNLQLRELQGKLGKEQYKERNKTNSCFCGLCAFIKVMFL
jgi:hypothetical protein